MSREMSEEEQRRQNEISAFAAMALADDWPTDSDDDAVVTKSSPLDQDPTPDHVANARPSKRVTSPSWMQRLRDKGGAAASDYDDDATPRSRTSDRKHAPRSSGDSIKEKQVEPTAKAENASGTFAFDSSKKKTTSMEKSNLAAALALMEQDEKGAPNDNQNNRPHHDSPTIAMRPSPSSNNNKPGLLSERQQQQTLEEISPMFAEQVILPRPLFFGPLVSPRIVRQARQMVLDATTKDHDASMGGYEIPRMQDLPGSVRNVVGALRVYGYGIDVLQDLKETGHDDDCEFWRGSPYVSTFQPLWGEAERRKCIEDIRSEQQMQSPHRPSQILRSSTAPGRLVPSNDPNNGILVFDGEDAEGNKNTAMIHEEKTDGMYFDQQTPRSVSDATAGEPTLEKAYGTDENPSGSPHVPIIGDIHIESQKTANQQFTAWIRGDEPSPSNQTHPVSPFNGDSWTPRSGGGRGFHDGSWNPTSPDKSEGFSERASKASALSEQELFSMNALGETTAAYSAASSSPGSGSVSSSSLLGTEQVASGSFSVSAGSVADIAGTFQRHLVPSTVDSDDDSVEHDERKKQVGINDHLSKALASLAGQTGAQPNPIEAVDESEVLISQVDGSGRPKSNFELTSGCAPVFGVDDSPLPVEGDLGIHETKEEQQKSQEQKRRQEIVEKCVKPNVFGCTACPNPALGPDDFHSWNARVVGNQRLAPGSSSGGNLENLASLASLASQQQTPQTPQHKTPPQQQKQHPSPQHSPAQSSDSDQPQGTKTPSQRSLGKESRSSDASEAGRPPKSSSKKPSKKAKLTLSTRYGWWNIGDATEWPGTVTKPNERSETEPDETRSEDKDGSETKSVKTSHLHSAPLQHSASALQVVTQLEPSPGSLQKENLPLSRMHAATTMAQILPFLSDRPPSYRYLQVDTQAVGFPPLGGEVEPLFCSLAIYNIETMTNAPQSDQTGAPKPDIQRCGRVTETLNFEVFSDPQVGSLCESALFPYEPSSPFAGILNVPDSIDIAPSARRRVGTKCGVFPLPSSLNFSNLYAVLLVKKVLSEDSLDMYLKAGSSVSDVEKLRVNASKASQRQSAFLMVFGGGSESPVFTLSRAVQIPLFRFSPGGGERQIIDHIMVMLSPREHRASGTGSPVSPTNGGTAMLVMRNFGFLGLHSVVDGASSLARDRLVDFSGELQLRRKAPTDKDKEKCAPKRQGCKTTISEWKPEFVSEPVEEGGRCLDDSSKQTRYAQELSPIQLQLSPSLRLAPPTQPSGQRAKTNGTDIEPFYHTCFCNEMILQPRMLSNCPKGNIVIKAELRELEWSEALAAYVAHLPRSGPSFHNNRRGPFLVQSVLTSCAPRGSDKNFMDEFKLKLPLDLVPSAKGRSLRSFCLFFTVYDVKMGTKSKWKRAKKIFTGSDDLGFPSDSTVTSANPEQLASGFLPISGNGSLLDDGMHDVKVLYYSQEPTAELVKSGVVEETSLLLVERNFPTDPQSRGQSWADDEKSISDSVHSKSDYVSNTDESRGSDKGKAPIEPIALSVRICANSSLHAQNPILSDYLHEEDDSKEAADLTRHGFLSTISMGKDLILEASTSREQQSEKEHKALKATLEIVKFNICPVTRTHSFLFRAMTRLWRTLIFGTGEASLAWSNPATPIHLRISTFASILQLLGGSSLYYTKNNLTQADGSKWSIVSLARIVALVFDEQGLFGESAHEAFDPGYFRVSSLDDKAKSKRHANRRKRHVRSNIDLYDLQTKSVGSGSGPSHVRRFSDIPSRQVDLTGRMSESAKTPSAELVKIDSKTDFQSALRAANSVDDDFDRPESNGSRAAKAMIQAFGGTNTGNRRWMTAPTRALTTIKESDDSEIEDALPSLAEDATPTTGATATSSTGTDSLDEELKMNRPRKSVKQMRIPRARKPSSSTFDFSAIELEEPPASSSTTVNQLSQKSIPQTDDEIQSAGTAFLDVIGKSLGVGSFDASPETDKAGYSHHRKTKSRSSIDWTLIGVGDGFAPSTADDSSSTKDFAKDQNECLTTLKNDEKKSILLPDFGDRLIALERHSAHGARWFPFAYEVIILQWAAILVEQRALGDRVRPERGWKTDRLGESSDEHVSGDEGIAEAASRSIGVAVAGAPLLFEVIKESLGFRIASLFRAGLEQGVSWTSPPLVVLDESLFLGLEQVISMIADACIDSRNFDSWELRQMSIDVNDSIIRFLRDMFSFLSPKTVHRLTLTYLSRFVTKEGKHWQDRDSAIGLRCSWEITKLRLNAITGLIRFPDFIKVNSPQMLNWSQWWAPCFSRSDFFFDEILERYRRYCLPEFVATEGSSQHLKIDTPGIHSHWLSEICMDICLLGTEHAEPQIQQRSASLLHELFWSCSQEGTSTGRSAPIASMLVSFVWRMLSRVDYLSNFSARSQLRKDLLPCVIYVLQSSPGNLLRALWRKLCKGLKSKGSSDKFGGFSSVRTRFPSTHTSSRMGRQEPKDDPDVLDFFSLLNLALRTLEYEGSEEHLEKDGAGTSRENVQLWKKEFLPSASQISTADARSMRKLSDDIGSTHSAASETASLTSSTVSRRWFGHDGSLVAVNAAHQLVWELYRILSGVPEGESLLNPSVNGRGDKQQYSGQKTQSLPYTHVDIAVFVRAASSVYLHALALRQSDIVVVRTFKVSAELIKIFGIKKFLEGVGETLQHWMRVISLQCGARRAVVRIEATDLLELILRSTWHAYGSFFRIRVPLLAVQTEVMERIVATAASRYYRDQRRLSATFEPFSNVNAEASLVPLWRTLDRIEKQPASQNVAFRGALIRMAGKLKKLYRAYIAARVLSFIHGSRSENGDEEVRDHATEALVRANRISILRVINASEGHSKQFLGFHATTQQRRVAHFEAVEDALIDAADVFSPTELPEHRVAWLRMLADFHSSRGKFAEEATCHFHIHLTLQQAARLHGTLWSNTPFLPWTDNIPDPVYIDGDSPTGDPDFASEYCVDEERSSQYGNAINSFRRIFYRVANSIALNTNEWENAANKNLFCGITSASEYNTVSPWLTLRDMEDQMVEEAELAGDLFLRAGIVESSRFSWNLATQFYAQKFNYAKLAMTYRHLERTVVATVPPIDASLPQEVSATLGRFYRVWFHGGAPDELSGVEFVYRAEGNVKLEIFGQELMKVIKSIIPDNTPIHLVLDGRTEERIEENGSTAFTFNRLGPASLEPVRIKITPLRPLFSQHSGLRGLPEWFYRYADEAFETLHHRSTSELARRNPRVKGSPGTNNGHHREHNRSYSASVGSSTGSFSASSLSRRLDDERGSRFAAMEADELSGVDKFCFVQPKDRSRSKDWWRNSGSDFANKTLKVTQLQVGQAFPACVARQPVVHRLVYSQSPLEAGIDAVCQWCAVLFRTAVATVGMAVLGTNQDPGIGTDAVKIVADCIHSSHVKEIGLALMKKVSESKEGDSTNDLSLENYDRLSEFEIQKLQVKIARLIIVFIELLHLLISRNRQLLLDFMQERKRSEGAASSTTSIRVSNRPQSVSTTEHNSRRGRGQREGSQSSPEFAQPTPTTAAKMHASLSVPMPERNKHRRDGSLSDYLNARPRGPAHQSTMSDADQHSQSNNTVNSAGRGESAIAVQSELQRAFINMVKSLYPKIQAILQGETPRWLKQCAQDTYFSLGTYKQTRIPIDEELRYTAESMNPGPSGLGDQKAPYHEHGLLGSSLPSLASSPKGSANGSQSNYSGTSRHGII